LHPRFTAQTRHAIAHMVNSSRGSSNEDHPGSHCDIDRNAFLRGSRAWSARAHLKGNPIVYKIAISLFMLWLLGVVYSYTMDGYIHALLLSSLAIALMHYVRTRSSP
jgi:hypothetical protein